MGNLFSACLLIQDGLSSPELQKSEVSLHPGMGFASDLGDSILLAGGFSSIASENGFPLSPTLQLNADLTSASLDALKPIALAELNRHNNINYRSYALDANKRVCVVGSDLKRLSAFLDTYGGLLEITPLLTKGSCEEIPTALDINITQIKNGCRIEYQVQSPIDLNLCNYCGECGPKCPEQCISENLFIDFNKCTYCKECEAVCPVNAIDVHGAVIEMLDVPAIILLDDQGIDLPENVSSIFREDDLPQYLSSLYPCQIDEVVACDNSICQFSSRLGFGCKICQVSCKFEAISTGNDGISIDALKCVECGACISACPTGALQNERFNDESFFHYFKEVELPVDATVVLGAEKAMHSLWWMHKNRSLEKTFFLQFENISSLSLFHFAYLLDCGARRIVVLQEEAGQNQQAAQQIGLMNGIINGLFGADNAVIASPVGQFMDLMQDEPSGSFGQGDKKLYSFVNRRQALGQFLEGLMLRSGNETPVIAEDGFLPFAQIICDPEKCTHCMACINDCQIQAMQANQEELTLNHLGVMCVGCGICVRVCPENALAFGSEVAIAESFFTPVELASAEPMKCKKCGKVFGTKKSFDRVMEILRQKETVDTSHFEYCETCRVVNLFEAE